MRNLDGSYNLRLIGFEPILFGTEIQYFFQLSYKRKNIMIQPQTILTVKDNSGAQLVKCIKILGGFKRKFAKIGNIIVISIQKLKNKSKTLTKIKKGEMYRAIIIKTKRQIKKKDGLITVFRENAVSLINKQNNPIGTRIVGSVSKILKSKYMKFMTISSGSI